MTATALKEQNKTNGWTPERRAAQSARLRAARIWLKSTGPRSIAGKARSSRNAYKTGVYTGEMRLLRAALRSQRRFLNGVILARTLLRRGCLITPAARQSLFVEGMATCVLLDRSLEKDLKPLQGCFFEQKALNSRGTTL